MGWTFKWCQKRGLGNETHGGTGNAHPSSGISAHIIDQKMSMRKDDSTDVAATLMLLLHHAVGAGCSGRVELEQLMKRDSTCA